MKLMWTGSDVLYLRFPKQSRKVKYVYFATLWAFAHIADLFVEGHYVVSEHLRDELPKFRKPVKVLPDPCMDVRHIGRKSSGIVLYYCPRTNNQKLTDWIYGRDLYERARLQFADMEGIEFMHIDGNQDICDIYPHVGLYLRPNRHDGNPRMITECEQIGIPFYWTRENPCYQDMVDAIFENMLHNI